MQLALIRGFHHLAGTVAPHWTARRARVLFTHPRRGSRRPWEEAVLAKAERVTLDVGFRALRWRPEGEPVGRVLCMHGWEGRATQFGTLADALVDAGYEVLALDGPGHGESPEEQAHPVAFARALMLVDQELGPFDHVVGHSMGAGALVVALSWGLRAERAVLLASPSSIEGVLGRFGTFIGLPDRCKGLLMDEMGALVGVHPEGLHIAAMADGLVQTALVLHDPEDVEVPVEDGRAIAEHWPNARWEEVRGVGHRRILRDGATVERVVAFLRA